VQNYVWTTKGGKHVPQPHPLPLASPSCFGPFPHRPKQTPVPRSSPLSKDKVTIFPQPILTNLSHQNPASSPFSRYVTHIPTPLLSRNPLACSPHSHDLHIALQYEHHTMDQGFQGDNQLPWCPLNDEFGWTLDGWGDR
jgi:hypothetical protein